MKNVEQTTLAQKVENQQAEIESLQRKIASLEGELQKCLDPDSGEINPSIRYEYKVGEAGLLRKIQSLEQQLSECVETGSGDLIKDRRRVFEGRIYTVITAAFLPVTVWSEHSKDHGLQFQAWWAFRQSIFDSELFYDRWSRLEFRQGVDMLNDICQATENGPTEIKQFEKYEFANRLFGYDEDRSEMKHAALQELINALLVLIKNHDPEDRYISTDEFNDMLAALRIVSFCQRLWMDAKWEEKEVEAE